MANVSRYAAIFTKVKALESRLLRNEHYALLLAAKDIQEVTKLLLNQTPYGVLLDPNMSTRDVERTLRHYVFKSYEQMIHYTTNEDRKLFKALIIRYEIELLKNVIRSVSKEANSAGLMELTQQSKHFEIRDFKLLASCHSLDELVADLIFTPYGALLKPYLSERDDQKLFFMEMVLDRYYFKNLADQMQHLSGDGRRFMLELLGTNIDLLNIQWVYRGKKHYNLSPELLFNYCLRDGLRFGLKRLREICYLEDVDAFVEEISKCDYGFLFSHGENTEILMERNIERALYTLFLKLSKMGQLSLVTPIGYLHKLEYELRDVFSIMEAKRYGLNARETSEFLVRTIPGDEQW